MHPYIVGELACGSLSNRNEILSLLQLLPACVEAEFNEVLSLINTKKIYGKGVGFVDVSLVASALLTGCLLWTADKRLQAISDLLKVKF